ncbi:hypothetical protein Hdeb2414_s0009g00320481 [Helianthus debilis subsp. tardiflorus]
MDTEAATPPLTVATKDSDTVFGINAPEELATDLPAMMMVVAVGRGYNIRRGGCCGSFFRRQVRRRRWWMMTTDVVMNGGLVRFRRMTKPVKIESKTVKTGQQKSTQVNPGHIRSTTVKSSQHARPGML